MLSHLLLQFALSASAAPSGYCEMVQAQAESRSANLMLPELFVSAGFADADTAAGLGTPSTGKVSARLMAGARYSFASLYRGLTLQKSARAECRRHQAQVVLEAALRTEADLGLAPALLAERQALQSGRAQAESMLAEVQARLGQGRATAVELAAMRSRVDGLEGRLHRLEVELARTQQAPPSQALAGLVSELSFADGELEKTTGRLRASEAWDVSVRAAYDRLLGQSGRLPLFAMVTFSYDLGGPLSQSANARAVEARGRWREEDTDGLGQRTQAMVARLSALRQVEQGRLAQLKALSAQLDQEVERLCLVPTEDARRFHGSLWFDALSTRAQAAYLSAHLAELDTLLGAWTAP